MDEVQYYIDFIEGNLSELSEQKFAEEIASNIEFRSGFKSFLLITDSMRRNSNIMQMPDSVTNSIFSSIGIPFHTDQLPPKKSFSKNLFSNIGKNKFINGLTLGLIMAAGALFIIPGIRNNFTNDKDLAIKTENTIPSVSTPKNTADYPMINQVQSNNDQQNIGIKRKKQISTQIIFEDKNLSDSEIDYGEESIENSTKLRYFDSKSEINNVNYYFNNNNFNSLVSIPQIEPNHEMNLSNSLSMLNLNFELSNYYTWNIPSPKLTNTGLSPFNNFSLSILYQINDKFRVGLEARQEAFYTEYTGTEPDGNQYKYYEQSNLISYCARLRYTPFEFNNFKPAFQLGLGFNKVGLLARPMVGLEYKPYPNIVFNLGVEYTGFWYNHQGTTFSTTKLGIVDGFSLIF